MKLFGIILILLSIYTSYSISLTCQVYSQSNFDSCWQTAIEKKMKDLTIYVNVPVSFNGIIQSAKQLSLKKFEINIQGVAFASIADFNLLTPAIQQWSNLTSLSMTLVNNKASNVNFFNGLLQNSQKLTDLFLYVSTNDLVNLDDFKYIFDDLPSTAQNLDFTVVYCNITDISFLTNPLPKVYNLKYLGFDLRSNKIQNVENIAIFTKNQQINETAFDFSENKISEFNTGTFFVSGKTNSFAIVYDDNKFNQLSQKILEQVEIDYFLISILNTNVQSFSDIYPALSNLQIYNAELGFSDSIIDLNSFDKFSQNRKHIGRWDLAIDNIKPVNLQALENSFLDVQYNILSIDIFKFGFNNQDLTPLNSLFFNSHDGLGAGVSGSNCDAGLIPQLAYNGGQRYLFGKKGTCVKIDCSSVNSTCNDCRNNSEKGECQSCIYGYNGKDCRQSNTIQQIE